MGRGAGQAARRQLDVTNAIGAQQGREAEDVRSRLLPNYMTDLTQGGFTPEEQSGITTAGMEATAAPFDTASQMAQNRAARTRNEAGTAAQEDVLAREKGEAMGQEAAGLQEEFGKERIRGRRFGESGLAQLYGGQQETMARMYGLGPETIMARNKASVTPDVLGLLGQFSRAGAEAYGDR